MPLLKVKDLNATTQVWVWEITETFDELFQSVALKDVSLARVENMKSEGHQKGFLSVRRLLMEAGYTDFDLYYDEFGKPHLREEARSKKQESRENTGAKHISISHSHDFSVIVLSDVNIGADLEILKDKTLKLAPRFMDVSHLANLTAEDQLIKATVVWGIKESVFKIKNEIGISFKDDIFESEFNLSDKKCSVELRFNNKVEHFDIVFDFIKNYVFVCAFEAS
ncbi:4'-phosphopantetheinyl transferase family protein [Flavobacterium sp. N1994]|uniref:4'-phosphopantetheinyl transferase family protein n=1 Tax=Flavobacterium sp. N1994 TaxID=2986827 RepID=UPI00222263BD|nr:4-phosphopantetheinyl transferase [Flavobacterium sp. N1994]